ncbi:YoaK family protein [Bradyrhizobium viridifuturi]|uniref:YoaK family protein n=1 Tax=Bradyrhizobium viridifuturi TaxID=1654716 RepID=UPI00067EA53E|nr:YoaK family protein [Bradyrhizobium viridifuturi]
MSSFDIAVRPPLRGEETVLVALLLAFVGGYIDAYTWVVHGVMANAQTANLIFLWVYGTAGEWTRAIEFVPPMLAFAAGVAIASLLRGASSGRARAIATLMELVVLIAIGILHNRMPDIAGTLGVSFVAAIQAAMFTKIEGASYSTVMITGNLRQAIENVYAVVSRADPSASVRRSGIFAAVCVLFGLGAAAGAFATRMIPDLTLGIPVTALLVVLLRCEARRSSCRNE